MSEIIGMLSDKDTCLGPVVKYLHFSARLLFLSHLAVSKTSRATTLAVRMASSMLNAASVPWCDLRHCTGLRV